MPPPSARRRQHETLRRQLLPSRLRGPQGPPVADDEQRDDEQSHERPRPGQRLIAHLIAVSGAAAPRCA